VTFKPIIIVPGEKKSIFFEIFFKSIRNKRLKSPLIIIFEKFEFLKVAKKNKFKKEIRLLDISKLKNTNLSNKILYLIDTKINYKLKLNSKKIYTEKSFDIAFKLIENGYSNKLLNGPVNKKDFLNKKFLGVTEYISSKFNRKKFGMLIYNKKLSVCPVTTHLPIKMVAKKITKKLILDKILIINNFYKKYFRFKPRIAITGLNPHCESILNFNEDKKIILPAIQSSIKKNINVKGPFSADTVFLRENRKKFDVVIGMYHDQVITPIKTLFEYDAINITMGLDFLRVTPDHGPNEKMVGKNKSNPLSLIKALNFLDKK
jgi:4-hydroxy-L-threonine phosphate dehydrogenase PdxA